MAILEEESWQYQMEGRSWQSCIADEDLISESEKGLNVLKDVICWYKSESEVEDSWLQFDRMFRDLANCWLASKYLKLGIVPGGKIMKFIEVSTG